MHSDTITVKVSLSIMVKVNLSIMVKVSLSIMVKVSLSITVKVSLYQGISWENPNYSGVSLSGEQLIIMQALQYGIGFLSIVIVTKSI